MLRHGAPPNAAKVFQKVGWALLCMSLSSSGKQAGFDIKEGTHPIVPIMLFDAALAGEMAQKLLQRGLYLTAFSYPVVPKGQARIRVWLPPNTAVLHLSLHDHVMCFMRP